MTPTRTAALRSRLAMVPLAVALFASSGDLRWIGAWIYIALIVASSELMLFGPLRVDEGLVEERLKPKPGAKPWDKIFVALGAESWGSELLSSV